MQCVKMLKRKKTEAFVLRSYATFELGVVVRTQIGFPPIPPVHKHTGWESIGGEGEILNTQIKA